MRVGTQTNRAAETILGILGSVIGIMIGLGTLTIASIVDIGSKTNYLGIFDFSGIPDVETLNRLGIIVIIVCLVSLIASCLVNMKRILMGVLLFLGGILNLIFIGRFGILSGSLILAAGILALTRK